ncbi:MAG: hypothetical protein DVB23_003047, partial [Verrucomicrobia bacterium]
MTPTRILLPLTLILASAQAQTLPEATKLFDDGQFAEAFALCEKLLDAKPPLPSEDIAKAVATGTSCL